MKGLSFLFVFLALLLLGCHKKAPASVENSTAANPTETGASPDSPSINPSAVAPANPPDNKPSPPSPAVIARAVNVPRENIVGDVDAALTAELRNFIRQKNRMPQSFGEFANLRLDSIPRPPDGKKWAIDTADLQVKAVPAK